MAQTFNEIDHAKNILQNLRKQCENEELCDIVLVAGNAEQRIPAHRSILAAASEYFKGMFTTSLRESTLKEIKLSSLDGSILKSLVEFFYTGQVVITEDIVVELLKTADMLLLRNVVTACGNFLADQLHPSNCLGLKLLADQHQCEALSKIARDYSRQHFMDVAEMDEFLNLNAEQLIDILKSDDLCVFDEEDVFMSVMTWIANDRNEREQRMAELWKLVRLPLLRRSFLIEHVKPMSTSVECLQIYIHALEFVLLPENSMPKPRKITKRSSNEFLMAITKSATNAANIAENKMCIHYYCDQELKWMKWSKDLEFRNDFGIAVMGDNIFIVGGSDAQENVLNTVICLNLKSMDFKNVSPMKEFRSNCSANVLNGFLYAVGGIDRSSFFCNSVEKWDPKTNEWKLVASMSNVHCIFSTAILSEKLYAVGGLSNHKDVVSAENYDPILNVWKPLQSTSCKLPQITVTNGQLYAVGFCDNVNTIERYDPVTNKWIHLLNNNEIECNNFQCISFHDKILMCCNDSVHKYNSSNNRWEKEQISLAKLGLVWNIFSYPGRLLTSEFTEN